jgi:hypothetical protein
VKSEKRVTFGSHGIYEWLVADEDINLLKICPEIVLGKYVAITSIDSGAYLPDEQERAAGWDSRGRVAYSPKITNTDHLPRSPEAYDEWYVFLRPIDLGNSHLAENIFAVPQAPGHISVFVNYGGFAFDRPDDLTELFWKQIEWIRPESYIADGLYLNFVTANKGLFASIRRAIDALFLGGVIDEKSAGAPYGRPKV